MSASALGTRQSRTHPGASGHSSLTFSPASMVARCPGIPSDCSFIDLGDSTRVSFMLTPEPRGDVRVQLQELLSKIQRVLSGQARPMYVTSQTVFLADSGNQGICEQLFGEFYGRNQPVTNYVLQPPCSGAALALEAWSVGGGDVRLEHCGPHALAVSYDGVRWIYCGGIVVPGTGTNVHGQTVEALNRLAGALEQAGSGMEDVVRTWFYLGEITGPDGKIQRYQELNRGRTDYYRDVRFCRGLVEPGIPRGIYPASTGIGMNGHHLVAGCVGLQTRRADAFVLPLENPQQTPAYAYHPKYSPESPKFSRAVALGLGDYITTWISGTASIVNSESRHQGDIVRQTEQTLDNIESLIAPENFAFNGLKNAGARLHDLAKIRVYVKRAEDAAACRAVCERRLGPVPAIYATADVCRPELLVEIEGIAFSRRTGPRREGNGSD